jgi:hypothetical protein
MQEKHLSRIPKMVLTSYIFVAYKFWCVYIVTARHTPLGVSIEKTDSLSWKKEIWPVHSDLFLKIPSEYCWNNLNPDKIPTFARNYQSFCS